MTPASAVDTPPTPEALLRAYGLALATLESLLISKGVLATGELSEHLATMERVTTEVDVECGDVLHEWAQMLAQVDAAQVGARH